MVENKHLCAVTRMQIAQTPIWFGVTTLVVIFRQSFKNRSHSSNSSPDSVGNWSFFGKTSTSVIATIVRMQEHNKDEIGGAAKCLRTIPPTLRYFYPKKPEQTCK